MKLKNWMFVLLVGLFMASCGGDDEDNGNDINYDNPTFAKKTVAETKSDLEQTGTNTVAELKELNQEKGVQASVMFVTLMDNSSSYVEYKKSPVYKTLSAVSSLASSKPQIKKVLKMSEITTDDSFLSSYDAETGVYEYSFDDETFVKVNESDKIVYKFPSNQSNFDSQTLNASLTIPRPTVITGNYTIEGVTELPTSLSFTVAVDNATALTFNFTGNYNSDGIPTQLESTLTIGTWVLDETYSYSKKKMGIDLSFKHSSTVIFDLGAQIGGNLTEQGIENAIDSTYVDSGYGFGYYEYNTHFEKVIQNANAHLQIMDIKIAGQVDFQNLVPAIEKDSTNYQKQANDINKYADLVVVYASNNQAIAKAQAVVVTETSEWGYSNEYIDFNLIFADNSKSTLDDYFNEGFSGVIDEMNSLIEELNSTYGWEIAPIETTSSEK
jgi:hypothetical protein